MAAEGKNTQARPSATPRAAESGKTAIAEPEQDLAALKQRVGNRNLAAMVRHSLNIPPAEQTNLLSSMSRLFAFNFSNVRLRVDAEAAMRASGLRARAYTDGTEIGFAVDAFAPRTLDGQRRLVHEFAHVVQLRGGNCGANTLKTINAAENEADLAAEAALHGKTPRVSFFPGLSHGEVLCDKPKIDTKNDLAALESLLKNLDERPERDEQRTRIIEAIALMAVQPGPAQERAVKRLTEMVSGVPKKDIGDHHAAMEALRKLAPHYELGYDLVMAGRLWYADKSQGDIGSDLAVGIFQNWLHYKDGRFAIGYLRRRLKSTDTVTAMTAARLVADLLEREDTQASKYHKNYEALRVMAMENGWLSHGALGAASATPRIYTALDAVRAQTVTIERLVRLGPLYDQWEKEDLKLLLEANKSLNRFGFIKTTRVEFTAENREENEHYYLREDPKDAADKLLEFATAVTMAADAGARLEAMTESLHDFVYAIDQEFPDTTQGLPEKRLIVDERDALFEVRHLALVDWLSLFNETFQGGGGIADEYALRLKEAEGRFENFDRVVAKRKTERMKKHFEEFAGYFENGKQAYEGNKALKHEFFFFRVRDILEQDHKTLTEGFAERVETPLPSGQTLVIDQRKFGWGENLEQAARLELFTKVFGLRSALFYFYAANLSLHQKLIEVDAGSEEFQERVGKELAATRKELQDIFWSDNYDAFLKRTKVYEQQINDLAKEIKERVQIDILKSLAITIVAALVTQGAALAVRLATFSRVVAIMRTARAISTVGTLFEIGVFTAAELSMQKGFMGKQITADKAMKSLANNLIFLGALKIVGAFAKPFGRLAQGSPFRQLFFGHMVGFGGVAGVSATIHKIEKGQWPPDMAAFLVQTAATYVVLAVIHKSFNNLVSKPLLEKAARQRIAEINAKNESLFKYANDTASRGKADKAAAESIRTQRIEAIEETRAIARVLKDGGALNADELTIVEKFADDAVAEAKAWNFPPQTNEVTALPSPESAFGIVRVGDSNTYVYEPSLAKAELAEMLDVYRSKGFTVTGSGGYTLVADTRGRTRFLLSAAPIPDLPALPPGPQGAGAAPIATPSGLKGIELVLVVEEGMDANDVRRKAAALNDLAERGKISKKEETVGTRAVVSGGVGASYMGMPVSVPGEYKYRILDQAHRIFGPQSPNYNPQRWRKFFDLWKKKSGDHVLDLQLTGADEVGNIWLFDLQTNVALGRQIARQLARVPGGTRIEKVTVKTASPALPGDEDED